MSGWYSANLAIWLVPRAGSILPIRLAHSRRYPILCVRDYINYVVATFHSLIWYLSLNNFSLFTTKINSDMDSGHSESEFYYPDEVERRKWRRKYRFATERKRTKGSVYDGECAKVYFNTMSRKCLLFCWMIVFICYFDSISASSDNNVNSSQLLGIWCKKI